MTLKELLNERDLESDRAGLKADAANAGQPELGISAEINVEVSFDEDQDEPEIFTIGVEYDEMGDDEIEIVDYDNIPNVDKKLLGSALHQVDTMRKLHAGVWITLYDEDYGSN